MGRLISNLGNSPHVVAKRIPFNGLANPETVNGLTYQNNVADLLLNLTSSDPNLGQRINKRRSSQAQL